MATHTEFPPAELSPVSVVDPGFLEGGFWYTLVREARAKF